MIEMITKMKRLAVVTAACAALTPAAHAAVVISNIELTTTSLSFDLVGTIDDVVGQFSQESLFLGEEGNSDWIGGFAMGNWDHTSGTFEPNSVLVLSDASAGDRVVIASTNDTLQFGDTIDGTFTLTGGNFDPTKTDTSKWILSAGYNTFTFPDPTTQTGSVVPEPTSLAAIFVGGLLVLRRRRQS
ncbi:MAG: PEP-CTERM sorting domain-containing protein [Phycisphaeraceae bacterium]